MRLTLLLLAAVALSCNTSDRRTLGTIERLDPALDSIVDNVEQPEILAEGFEWSEGPVWSDSLQALLFSDVPANTIYQWSESKGLSTYLKPSGYTGAVPRGGEPGSNGLLIYHNQLYLAQHGDRRIARMNASLQEPASQFVTLADRYEGKRLNSPNDLVMDRQGNIYFTDPPYGLLKNDQDSSKETPWQGVYRISASGQLTLLTDTLTRPNGIALSPDEQKLYVANSDEKKVRWYEYTLDSAGIVNGKIFYDASTDARDAAGSPDGMKMSARGILIASGPGGIYFFDLTGKVLGRIRIPAATANCALNADESALYITSDMYLLRLRLKPLR